MKYIRTKDGRILRVPFTKEEYDDAFPNTNMPYEKWFNLWVYDVEIIKQADTIEELCDCYSYDTETVKDYLVARSWKLHNLEREIYGCIKTDKGLIYVAKMNDKGELELL